MINAYATEPSERSDFKTAIGRHFTGLCGVRQVLHNKVAVEGETYEVNLFCPKAAVSVPGLSYGSHTVGFTPPATLSRAAISHYNTPALHVHGSSSHAVAVGSPQSCSQTHTWRRSYQHTSQIRRVVLCNLVYVSISVSFSMRVSVLSKTIKSILAQIRIKTP